MHNQLKKDTMIQNHEIDYYKSILPRFLNSRLTFLYLSSQLYSPKQCTADGIHCCYERKKLESKIHVKLI